MTAPRIIVLAGPNGAGKTTRIELFYFSLANSELAVARVAQRVLRGGHSIPEETVKRRFGRSLENLFQLYLPMVDEWTIYDNTGAAGPRLVAHGTQDGSLAIEDATMWQTLQRGASNAG